MIYDRYYYYSCLSKEEKQIYKLIYSGLQNFRGQIVVPRLAGLDICKIISAIDFDNPHLFYVCFEKVNTLEGLTEVVFSPQYYFSKQEASLLYQTVQTKVGAILQKVGGADDYEKELSLHDLLAEKIIYDEKAKTDSSRHRYSCTILGVLLYKSAVCEGIAKAVKFLLNLLEIKCIVVHGNLLAETDAGHAWNIVKLNGWAVHLDVTNDLDMQGFGTVHHTFFNLTDAQIAKTHSMEQKYPVCSSDRFDYFVRNALLVYGKKDLERILLCAYGLNKRCVEVRVYGAGITKEMVTQAAMNILLHNTSLRAIHLASCENKAQGTIMLQW